MIRKPKFVLAILAAGGLSAQAQNAPNVSQVLLWSTLTSNRTTHVTGVPAAPTIFTPNFIGTLPKSLLSVYSEQVPVVADLSKQAFFDTINTVGNYKIANNSALNSALSANIAVSLSLIPLESPTSSVIRKVEPATGAELPVSSTLGPIFTKRAESIGKGKFYIGFTHQDFHFTSFNGHSLNGLSVLYAGGDSSGILAPTAATTAPATINLAMDVRISQDVAALTYGVTRNFDVTVGLPMVHAAVASTAYNGVIYSGTGTDFNNGDKCWCVNTFTPGSFDLTAPVIGNASSSKTGFGDLLLRFKDTVKEGRHAVVAAGLDLRLPTGDADNFLGTGTTSVKPFLAVSLYSNPVRDRVIFAPHFDIGWQFSGKSVLGGTIGGTRTTATLATGTVVPVEVLPFTFQKNTVPDIFSWAVGTEVALGKHNTILADIIGNQIGWINGVPTLQNVAITAPAPAGAVPMTSALAAVNKRTSFGQYNGAFGYKTRVLGNLVATFQILVRFDNNGLTARAVPLYGLAYSF